MAKTTTSCNVFRGTNTLTLLLLLAFVHSFPGPLSSHSRIIQYYGHNSQQVSSTNHRRFVSRCTGDTISSKDTEIPGTDPESLDRPPSKPLTSMILRISYDGSRFTGWSAANRAKEDNRPMRRKKGRRRGRVDEFYNGKLPQGFVRSVEGVVKDNFAKLYGDVDPNTRIVCEGCSRTDKGVHANCLIAQVYCLKEEALASLHDSVTEKSMVISGKRIPHPATPTDDSSFQRLPMNGNLSKLAFSFNRMRPEDIQITGIAPTPTMKDGGVFHASLSSQFKTYEYRISNGYLWDPTQRKAVWYTGSNPLDVTKMKEASAVLKGQHDFSAFQGAPRGSGEKEKRQDKTRDTLCTLYDVQILSEDPLNVHEDFYFPGVEPSVRNYKIVVTGDRFLYKMVRFLVGALVAVGNGKLDGETIKRALETKSWEETTNGRRKEFECAPPHGLTLAHVDYGEDIFFDWQPLRDPEAERRRKR